MIEDYKIKAIDPKQYDHGELNWEKEIITSPNRMFFYSYLEKYLGNLSSKRIIDIGSGTGYLAQLYSVLGAKEIFGIEPSQKNVRISRNLYPEMDVYLGSLDDFKSEMKFDKAISVMVFEHIADPPSAFKKIFDLLDLDGQFYCIVGNINYGTMPRFNFDIKIQPLDNNEVAVKTTRSTGVMYDIYRPLDNYIKYAKSADFSVVESIPMLPTAELLEQRPHYREFENVPMTYLLVLAKI